MIKKILFVVLAATAVLACTKEVLRRTGKLLAEVTLESDAGEIPVLITADGTWKATSLSDWIEVDDAWHSGTYSIVLRYASNRSVEGLHRPSRTGVVVIETADGAQCDTLKIHQRGIEP